MKIKLNKPLIISVGLLLLAVVLLSISFVNGGTKIGLFLIFPMIMSNDIFGALGMLALFAGVAAFFIGISLSRISAAGYEIESVSLGGFDVFDDDEPKEKNESKPKVQAGGVIFLGPIPIVFGSSKKIGRTMLLVAVVITMVLVVLFLLNVILIYLSP